MLLVYPHEVDPVGEGRRGFYIDAGHLPVTDAADLRIECGGPLRQVVVGQHGEVRPPSDTYRDGGDGHFSKVQLRFGRNLLVPCGFLQIREDLPVHGGVRWRDEAVGCLILFSALLPVSRVDGVLLIDVDC